jgi:hypothetical protein
MACVNLAETCAEIGQFGKAEDNFQKAFYMNNPDDHKQQEIHLQYARDTISPEI